MVGLLCSLQLLKRFTLRLKPSFHFTHNTSNKTRALKSICPLLQKDRREKHGIKHAMSNTTFRLFITGLYFILVSTHLQLIYVKYLNQDVHGNKYQNTKISERGISAKKRTMWPPYITTCGKKKKNKISKLF